MTHALSIIAKVNDLGWSWMIIMHCFKTHTSWCCQLFLLVSHSVCF